MELTRRIAAGALAVAVAAVAFFGFAGVAKADYIGVQVGQEEQLMAAGYYDNDRDKGLKISSSNESVVSCKLNDEDSLAEFVLVGNAPGSAKVSISYTNNLGKKVSESYTVKVSEQPINDYVELKAGQRKKLVNAPYYDDYYCKDYAVVSTNRSVACGVISDDDYDEFIVYASGFGLGTATLTYTWDETFLNKTETVTYSVDVKVKDAVISKGNCDALFTGNKYTVKKLSLVTFTSFSGGKFLKGSGYKVLNGGKQIQLTKTGAVSLKYKVGSTTHTIKLASVHSYEQLKTAAVKKAKSSSWYPKSFKLISTKRIGNCCQIKCSANNLFGQRVTQTVLASYSNGKVSLD